MVTKLKRCCLSNGWLVTNSGLARWFVPLAVWCEGGMLEQTVNYEQELGMPRCVHSCTARGGGSFLSLEEGWLGRGLLIPMSPWKKLVIFEKMGDMAGGSRSSGFPHIGSARFLSSDSSDSSVLSVRSKGSVIDIGGPPPWSLISASLAIDISYPVLGFAVQIAQFW